jgi:hypothetical protein
MVVLPLGVAYATDYEAVGERLRAAVEAKEITGEQARFMVGALRLTEGLGERKEKHVTREDYATAEAKMKAMVEAGEASEKDVRIRLGQMRRMIDAGRGKGDDWSRWEGIKQRIEVAVERGDLTREEADEKYAEMRRRMSRKDDAGGLDWKIMKQRIEGAVERGEMTRKQAKATYRALKR